MYRTHVLMYYVYVRCEMYECGVMCETHLIYTVYMLRRYTYK